MTQPSFETPNAYPQPGEVLDGKYRIDRFLGEGGMGAVARATHLIRRAPVALKFMSSAVMSVPGAVDRFVNEGVAASRIDSDHVVKVFDVGSLPNGAPYLVMELLEGQDMSALLEHQGQQGQHLDIPRAVHIVLQTLRALQLAHAAGIIHRDMKPSNVFITSKDGEPDFVKLVDFGISKVAAAEEPGKANLTRTNSALGTPLYMSPEQARSPRDVDHRTDLYSAGAILYEALSGRTPYTADSGEFTEILFKIFTTDPTPILELRPDLPPSLAEVIHRALARERQARYGSAGEMADALAPFADERSAQVLARLRGTRGRSIAPPHPQSVAPPAPETRAQPEEATARTFLQQEQLPKPARVPTDIGMTRETGAPSAGRKRASVVAIAVGAVVLAAGGIGFFAVRGARPAAVIRDTSAGESAAATAPSAAPSADPVPPLEQDTASPAASASAHTAASPRPGGTQPPRPATAGTSLPTQLGDLNKLK